MRRLRLTGSAHHAFRRTDDKTDDRSAGLAAVAWGGLVLLLLLLLLLLMLPLHADEHGLGPVIPKAKGESCVEPTEVMRRRHHEFILHQRDDTVIEGIRSEKYRFTRCIDCHIQATAAGDFPRHDDDNHFCAACHRFSSVSIDCFQCHADRPAAAYSLSKSLGTSLDALLTQQKSDNELSLRLLQQAAPRVPRQGAQKVSRQDAQQGTSLAAQTR